jgi:hypothetical protein
MPMLGQKGDRLCLIILIILIHAAKIQHLFEPAKNKRGKLQVG